MDREEGEGREGEGRRREVVKGRSEGRRRMEERRKDWRRGAHGVVLTGWPGWSALVCFGLLGLGWPGFQVG